MSEQLQAEGQDLQLFRDECLGSGAYGKVCRAELNELPCAAKLLHIVLFQNDDPQSPTVQRRFVQECELLQNMRHPNVAQYLGVTLDPQSGLPILLMELLDGNLTDFLEQSDRPIAYHIQVKLWHDIALALTYLHSKHIIHRDLSGNNVLLIAGNRAKVTDFGMSMVTRVDATKCRLTHCPGNAVYMSPEALIEPPIYSEKLDVFSSGVVALQIITQKFPNPAPNVTRCNDPNTSSRFSVTLVPEIDRRKDHINSIDPKHPMLSVVLRCLSDGEQDRPSAQELCRQLVTLKKAPEYTGSMQQKSPQERVREQEQQIQELQNQIDNERQQNQEQHHVVQQLRNDITVKERKLQELEQQIQELQKQIDNERQQNQKQHCAVQQLQNEITVKGKELQDLDQQIQEQKVQYCEQEQVVHELQQAIHEQQQQLEEQQSSNEQMQTQITKSERDMQVLNMRLHKRSQELQLKKQDLWRTQYKLQHKTKELQQKTEEFQQKREEVEGQLQRALQGQGLQDFLDKITQLESKQRENQDQGRLIEQLPPAFVTRFTAEELPHHLKKHIEEGFQEWEENLCKFRLFRVYPSSGDLVERKVEVHKNMTLGEVTERAYKVLELEKCGVQLEQCQLVRYNGKSGTMGKPFDEPKEMLLGEVVSGPQSCLSFDLFMEIQTDPATLPRHEQIMRAVRVIRTNYSLLWQHLDASKVLPKLVDKSVISETQKNEVESYQQNHGQNAVIINAVFSANIKFVPEGLLTICDTLQTTPGKENIAQHILRDYKQQPLAARVFHSLATGNAPLFSEVSLLFQNLQQDVVGLLVQRQSALKQLKQCLASLVLPLGDGKVASLVHPGFYEAASTIPDFFRLMAPYWNCLSTSLLSLLLEDSGCKSAAGKLAEFEEARVSSGSLVLCTQRASTFDLMSVHTLPLEWLQSLHPVVFAENKPATQRSMVRITAEVGTTLLHVSCLEVVTTAVCGFFRLPKAALVYAGCSENPLALCWLVSRDLLPYMRSHMGGTSGDHLLAEQQITQIAFGNAEFCKCPNQKEVELLEASRYALLERIPALLTSVSVDAADSCNWTSLHRACQEGHTQVAELLLQAGASVEQETVDGRTALYIAGWKGHDQIVELLLNREADVNHQTKTGQTALYIASRNDHDQIVELLLKKKADVNYQTKDGETPLFTASFDGHQRVVELLLAAGGNPNIQKKDGWTPLHAACQEGHAQVAELLLQAGASVEQETEDGKTALFIASRKGHDQIVELLLKKEADVNHQTKDGMTPLYTAIFNGHQRVVELLLAAGGNPNIQKKDGWTPLHVACQEGHTKVAELLLQAGASVEQETEDGMTPLYTAIFNGHRRVVELLLAAGGNPNIQKKDGWTPLHAACQEGHAQVAKLLLQAGASVELEAKDGQTALYVASKSGYDQIVDLLLRREAHVNHQIKSGFAALHAACFGGHAQVAELLLQAGASVEQQTKDGQTALHIASGYGHDQIVELLLRREADVNHQTKNGMTPLWTASGYGHQRVVERLLAAGGNPNIQEKDGFAALHVACQEGHTQVVELLLQAGASVEQETEFGQTPRTIARSEGYKHIVQLLHEANRQRTATKPPATPASPKKPAASPLDPCVVS